MEGDDNGLSATVAHPDCELSVAYAATTGIMVLWVYHASSPTTAWCLFASQEVGGASFLFAAKAAMRHGSGCSPLGRLVLVHTDAAKAACFECVHPTSRSLLCDCWVCCYRSCLRSAYWRAISSTTTPQTHTYRCAHQLWPCGGACGCQQDVEWLGQVHPCRMQT